MIEYDRIMRECFWDYRVSKEDIARMASSEDRQERSFLFEKILLNSTRMFQDLKVFEPAVLKELIREYQVPTFNHDYAFKKKNMAEVYFLGAPLKIRELQWVA